MINIDNTKLSILGLDAFEYLLLYSINGGDIKLGGDLEVASLGLIEKGYMFENSTPTAKGKRVFPKARNYEPLAVKIRELFPKGMKAGRHPWRCSVNALIPRLKKVETMGMKEYTDEQVFDAAKRYVNGFNELNRNNEMMLLQYFVFKDNNSTLLSMLESEEEEQPGNSIFTKRL